MLVFFVVNTFLPRLDPVIFFIQTPQLRKAVSSFKTISSFVQPGLVTKGSGHIKKMRKFPQFRERGFWPHDFPNFFFTKLSGSSETQNKHIKKFHLWGGSGLSFLSIDALFNWKKNKLSSKSWSWLIDAKSAIKKLIFFSQKMGRGVPNQEYMINLLVQ